MKRSIKNNLLGYQRPRPKICYFQNGFTLIEMIVSIALFAIVIIMAFDAMSNIGILRLKVSNRLDLNNELYSSTEKFTDLIKTGGDIDYEEYWNRGSVGTTMMSGHYDKFSGFGNYGSGGIVPTTFGSGLYYCTSSGTIIIGSIGCIDGNQNKQRYGQYRQQFIDYNSNNNSDAGAGSAGPGDEDANGNIRGDDDDLDLGMGPSAFTSGTGSKELYLIKKGPKSERTYFRWTLDTDPDGPPGSICEISGATMGSGNCLGNIQVLKLVGKDLGPNHTGGPYDGVIDTWECNPDYNCTLPTGINAEWVDIFPEWVNVKNINFYPYPEKDFHYVWKESDDSITMNSYVKIQLTLGLAWEKRKKIRGPSGDITITTTVNLSR